MGWLKSLSHSTLVIEKEKYFGELFHDGRGQPTIHRKTEEPEIFKSQVKSILATLNKAAGQDGIVMLVVLDYIGLDKITNNKLNVR